MLQISSYTYAALALTVASLLSAGCGDSGPQLGFVEGTILLDGKPLAEADVEFQPQDGSPSYGTTDSSGHYELAYTPGKQGAMVGKHVVLITTYKELGGDRFLEERLPERYHSESELTAEVEPGSQTIDFLDLKSK
jgi:hypothetical protein